MSLSKFYQRQNLRTRLIFAFMLTVLLPLLGTSLYGNWITSQTLQSRAVEAAQADLHLRHLQMEETLRGVEENLLFLSQINSLVALVNGRSPENLARAQIDFADFVSTHPDIFQARYLDETGMEIVRIDATPQGVTLPPPEQLQNKASRYYFTQTMALPPTAIFISPIDLNREFGQIQQPYIPTVRYATPLLAADGSPAGIVILNINAERLLQFARDDTLSLTDDDGYFLVHPNLDFEWGGPADLNSSITLQTHYPDSWQDIRQADQGVILPQPESGWQAAWEFITPFVANDDGRRALVFETVKAGNNRWHLINDLPRAALFASIERFRITAVFIVIWAMLLAAGIAMLFSRQIAQPIQNLTAKVRQFGQTHGAALPHSPSPAAPIHYEIDELEDAFQDMTAALELRRAELQSLLVQILSAQEEERRRVAYDIHDGLIQMLVGARLQLNNYLAEQEHDPEQAAQLQKGIDGLATAIVEARRVIEGLRPAALDDLGLVETVRYAAETLCQEKGCELYFADDVGDGRLPPAIETTAFRILQEAFTNARKYAKMSHLKITLKQEDNTFYATVEDDGDGFDLNQVIVTQEGGFGLRSMQERARLLGGDCVIESEIGVGTAVSITLPIKN
jgi:signal transduction histidine kinase